MPTIRADDVANLANVDALAERLGLSKRTVYKMVETGQIECVRVGYGNRNIRFTDRQIAEYLNRRRSQAGV